MGFLPIRIGGDKQTEISGPAFRELRQEQVIDVPRSELFEFFSRAENLQQLTPSSLHFKITTALPIPMKSGTLIDYTIRIHGVPILWRTKILRWDPPYGFSDAQIIGPYSYWIHEHVFEEVGPVQTRMIDTVRYRSVGGPLAVVPHFLFVDRQVSSIFDYRRARIEAIFHKDRSQPGQKRRRVGS